MTPADTGTFDPTLWIMAGAILLLLTFIIVFMNFVSDLLLAWLDPRIKLGA